MFRIKRKAVRTGKFLLFLEDLLYWLLVAFVMFSVVYYSNDGELRGFIFLGTLLGVVLYAMLFSRLIMKFSMAVLSFIAKCAITLYLVISFPFRAAYKLLSKPARYAARKTARTLRRAKITGKGLGKRIILKTKIFLNARKKI